MNEDDRRGRRPCDGVNMEVGSRMYHPGCDAHTLLSGDIKARSCWYMLRVKPGRSVKSIPVLLDFGSTLE